VLLRALGTLVAFALKLLWFAVVIVAPLFAAWVASSLAAHSGGSVRIAVASALLVFPVVPVGWELVARWRRARRARIDKVAPKPTILTTADRIVLRTLATSVLFLAPLLAKSPQRVFVSLNARGDWMLDGRSGAWVAPVRRALFRAAAGSKWLYKLTDNNPLHQRDSRRATRPIESRAATISVRRPGEPAGQTAAPSTDTHNQNTAPSTAESAPTPGPRPWPWTDELHPAVRSIPASAERSVRRVAHYLVEQERDPWQLAKAIHDYVADRIAYDAPAYFERRPTSVEAEAVLADRKTVCAGYANLYEAIAKAAGLEVVTIVGRARGFRADGMGEGHAWNAVRLGGQWHLVDTTWDAGYVDTVFHKSYRTLYFLTPPRVFAVRHWPDEARWQLLSPALNAGEYLRIPMMDPEFFAHELELREPDRAEIDARGTVSIRVANPRRRALLANLRRSSSDAGSNCEAAEPTADEVQFRCALPQTGDFDLWLYASAERYGSYDGVGHIRVHSR
jgi:hypothetical protein